MDKFSSSEKPPEKEAKLRQSDSPPYGWLTGLAGYLNEQVGRGNWAFTGSFAMYCWAWTLDGQAREPQDIDVLINNGDNLRLVAYGLRAKYPDVNGDFSPPGPTTQHVSVTVPLNVISGAGVGVKNTSIDLLCAGE